MQTNRKTVLITGGAKRVGKMLVDYFLSEGYFVAVHFNSSSKEANALKEKYPNDIELFHSDFMNIANASGLIPKVNKLLGHLDVLINSASIYNPLPILETSNEDLLNEFQVNLFIPFILTREYIRSQKKGIVINIADAKSLQNVKNMSAYLMSKKCLRSLTKLSAIESGKNIRINSISPGFLLPPEKTVFNSTKLINASPLKIKGDRDTLINTVEFILQNNYLNGQDIVIDGGTYLL